MYRTILETEIKHLQSYLEGVEDPIVRLKLSKHIFHLIRYLNTLPEDTTEPEERDCYSDNDLDVL